MKFQQKRARVTSRLQIDNTENASLRRLRQLTDFKTSCLSMLTEKAPAPTRLTTARCHLHASYFVRRRRHHLHTSLTGNARKSPPPPQETLGKNGTWIRRKYTFDENEIDIDCSIHFIPREHSLQRLPSKAQNGVFGVRIELVGK